MATVSYAMFEMLAYLFVLAILFGAVLLVLITRILVGEGIRSWFLWLKYRKTPSAHQGTSLHPAMAARRNS